jgi:hypothetical protein
VFFFNDIGVEPETGEAFLFLVGGGPKPLKSRVISTTCSSRNVF